MKTYPKSSCKKGSAMLASIILVLLVSAVLGSFLTLTHSAALQAEKNFIFNGLYNVAETAADKAMNSLKTGDWAGWRQEGNDYVFRSGNSMHLGNGRMCSMNVRVVNATGTDPVIYAEGRVDSGLVKDLIDVRQLKIGVHVIPKVKRNWGYSLGMVSKNAINFAGNNGFLASYDSRDGIAPDPANPNTFGYDITVATVQDENNLGVPVDASGVYIHGILASGGAKMDLSHAGLKVQGKDSPSGLNVDPNQVFYDFYTEFPEVPAAPTTYTATYNAKTISSMNTNLATPTTKATYNLTGQLKTSVTFTQGDFTIVLSAGANITGTSAITIGKNAKVTFFVPEGQDFKVAGNGIVTSGFPEKTQVYGSPKEGSAQVVKLAGNGQAAAVVYAPNSEVEFKGGGNSGQFLGAIVGNNVKLTGNSVFFFDVALKDGTPTAANPEIIGPTVTYWEEVIKRNEQYDFSRTGSSSTSISGMTEVYAPSSISVN